MKSKLINLSVLVLALIGMAAMARSDKAQKHECVLVYSFFGYTDNSYTKLQENISAIMSSDGTSINFGWNTPTNALTYIAGLLDEGFEIRGTFTTGYYQDYTKTILIR